jgi:hypothetical protein
MYFYIGMLACERQVGTKEINERSALFFAFDYRPRVVFFADGQHKFDTVVADLVPVGAHREF